MCRCAGQRMATEWQHASPTGWCLCWTCGIERLHAVKCEVSCYESPHVDIHLSWYIELLTHASQPLTLSFMPPDCENRASVAYGRAAFELEALGLAM